MSIATAMLTSLTMRFLREMNRVLLQRLLLENLSNSLRHAPVSHVDILPLCKSNTLTHILPYTTTKPLTSKRNDSYFRSSFQCLVAVPYTALLKALCSSAAIWKNARLL